MKWKLLTGKEVNFNPGQYKIDWNSPGRSKPETQVRKFLYPFWRFDVVLAELRAPKTLYRYDLCNLSRRIIIEVSPDSTHLEYNEFMHGSRAGYLKRIKSDFQKMELAEKNEFKFIELTDEHLNNLTVKMFKDKFDYDLI
jgi:hypothetical protein